MSDPSVTETVAEAAPTASPSPSSGVTIHHGAGQPVAMRGDVLPPKKRRRRVVLPLVLLAAIGGGGYEGYRWFVEGRFIVSTDDAYVKADTSIIAAKVGGYVSTVPIVENVHVTKGQILATIDDGDYRIAVDSAQTRIDTQDATIARIGQQIAAQNAMIDQAQAQLLSNKAEAQRTASEYQRAKSLMESSYGTQQRLDQALSDRDRAAAAVASAAAALTSAQANVGVLQAQKVEAAKVRSELVTALARAQRDLAFTVIRAPFDGVVGNKAVQLGQYVQTGTRLLALVPLDSAYVEANFKETQIENLRPGQKVIIKPDAFSSRSIEGSVESVAPASGAEFSMLPPENATGNFTKIVQRLPVRIKIPAEIAEERLLRPGLSVEVDVHTRDDKAPAPSLASAFWLDVLAAAVRPRNTQPD
jgi:membrane fusion protein (multidrug efflux system)